MRGPGGGQGPGGGNGQHAARQIGQLKLYIERVGATDPTIPGLPAEDRHDARYDLATQEATTAIFESKGAIHVTHAMDTKDFPPGRYKITAELTLRRRAEPLRTSVVELTLQPGH